METVKRPVVARSLEEGGRMNEWGTGNVWVAFCTTL